MKHGGHATRLALRPLREARNPESSEKYPRLSISTTNLILNKSFGKTRSEYVQDRLGGGALFETRIPAAPSWHAQLFPSGEVTQNSSCPSHGSLHSSATCSIATPSSKAMMEVTSKETKATANIFKC